MNNECLTCCRWLFGQLQFGEMEFNSNRTDELTASLNTARTKVKAAVLQRLISHLNSVNLYIDYLYLILWLFIGAAAVGCSTSGAA